MNVDLDDENITFEKIDQQPSTETPNRESRNNYQSRTKITFIPDDRSYSKN